jgi:1-deoxy-D-xylulose-5-phosphate reductoisomerase
VALSAGKNWQKLASQAREFLPEFVAIFDEQGYKPLKDELAGLPIQVEAGEQAVINAARFAAADYFVGAIVGAAGLQPVMAAINSKKTICLANKEALVVAGALVTRAAARSSVALLPVDSEHSAIFQSLQGSPSSVNKLVITASGGPFRNSTFAEMSNVTVEQALKHPNWNMGGKITIDSASMMNKGLEVIEAHWLFNQPFDKIEVVVHPQSIIHSLVEFSDGSVIAQLGWPDMKLPIQYALSYPERWGRAVEKLDLLKVKQMTFEEPDFSRFPCLKLAYEVGKAGRSGPCILNAANEVAVHAFMNKKIRFTDISILIEKTLAKSNLEKVESIEQLVAIDKQSRFLAQEQMKGLGNGY